MSLCEPPRAHHGLPPDPAIVQSSSAGSSGIYPALGQFSPLRMSAYNHLAAGSLLNPQYAAALGLGPVLPGLHVARGPMVEKAVQTLSVDRLGQRRGLTAFRTQEQQWDRRRPQRTSGLNSQTRRGPGTTMKSGPGVTASQQETWQQNCENRPPPRRRQGARRRRNRGRGQLIVANIPSPTLKFDTDFDFDSSNAQFIKEELEREVQNRMNVKGWFS
ncbi:protein LSM14 homolog B isoform X2 [Acanthochromis polyacanthus]|uniref:protein LSM14 homolog B isoform X2 n=1 Tax=Acanthochromis polyacanthus TaxID=80966 RepID=UPI002233F664|nr:protein LSM14 homolog B isoform X2 [Acanthochromis polyacanthus]